ncbi:MAG: restriction endonuclease subunit S, partial [Nitrospirae bacterium]|nr:restriction endonuclease subunit S [Nitrospirota bacterium]
SRKDKAYFEGEIPWVKSGELPDGPVSEIEEYITEEAIKKSSAKLFPAGTLLIALYGATVGKLGILNRDATTNQAVCAIFPTKEVDTKYLFWYLRYVRSDLIAQAVGGAQPNISQGILRELDVPAAPPGQQKRIVAEIEKQFSRLDEAVANLKRVKANLKRYKAAILKAAVEGKMTEEWRKAHPDVEPAPKLLERIRTARRTKWKGKYKEASFADTSNLAGLPEGWMWAIADQLSDFITKGTTPSASKLKEGTGEIQFLKVYNLTFNGTLNHNHKPAFVSRKTHEGELARSKVFAGDVLINIVGPPLGQVSVVPAYISEANINQAIARYRPIAPLPTSYLALALRAESVMRWAIRRAKTTAGQANLTLELCRDLPLPLPPLVEQQVIVAEVERRLSVIEELEAEVTSNLKRADRLRQSILQQAFQGNLASNGVRRQQTVARLTP